MILHVKVNIFGVFLLLLIVVNLQNNLFGNSPAPLPKLSEKNKKGVEGNFSLGILYNQGNYINVSGALNLSVKYFEEQNFLYFHSHVNYGEINYNGDKYIENVNQYSFTYKHMIFFKSNSKSYFFYGAEDLGNLFAGIKNRLNINEGLGYNFIDSGNFLLRGEFGFQYSDSKYLFQDDMRTVSGVLFYQVIYNPFSSVKLLNKGSYSSNLSEPRYQDYRFDDVTSLITLVTGILNLKSDLVISYVNIPPLIAQVDSTGVPIPNKEPVKGKRVTVRIQQTIMVKF